MKICKISIITLMALCLGFSVDAKSSKRGVSENLFQFKAQLEALAPGVSWFYNWSTAPGTNVSDQDFFEYVPMCWNGGFNADNIRNYVKAHPETKYLLGFNEPNFKSQANMTPAEAAERWPAVQALAKELNLEIVAPALNYSPDAPYSQPTVWMDEFVELVGLDAFDYTAIHNYGGKGVMVDLATKFHDKYGKPVWVTEFCYWPGEMGDVTVAAQLGSMIETLEWLEKTDWIFRYAWFKATENSRANFKLIDSGTGENPRELTELGKVYCYMPDFDTEYYHSVNDVIPATHYIDRSLAKLGSTADSECPVPIEVSAFNSGATLDYQFDIPVADDYNLELTVSGVGEPTRFNPNLSVVSVNADGSEGSVLSPAQSFGLSGSDTSYTKVRFPMSLAAGKQTIRLKDNNPYSPSGLRISTLKIVETAGVTDAAFSSNDDSVDVVNLQGVVLRRGVSAEGAVDGLPAGLYLVGGNKVLVK